MFMTPLCMLKIIRLIHCQSHDNSKIVAELNDLKKLVSDGQLKSNPERFHALEAKLPEELKNSDMLFHTQQLERTVESVIHVASSITDSQSPVGSRLSEMNPHSFEIFSELMPEDSASNIGSGRVGLVPRKLNDGIKEWLTGLETDETKSGITLKGEATSEHNDALQQGSSFSDISFERLSPLPGSPNAAKPGNSSAEQDSLDRALIALSRTKIMQNQFSMIPFLQDLISNGVNLDAQDEDGLTAMHWASREGHLFIVKFLCERGADMNLKSNEGQSALHEAIIKGHTSVVKYLLKNKATDIEQYGSFGETPLMWAARHGHLTILEALLKSGADVSAKDAKSNTALHLAAYYDKLDCVEFLLQNKAPLASRNQNGYGPLHLAAGRGYNKCVEHLLNAGAPLEAKGSKRYTALSLAASSGCSKVVERLLQAGAKTDYRDGRDDRDPPLNVAAAFGHNECAKLLLDAGAPLEAVNNNGSTALMDASRKGHSEITKLLLKVGANVDAQNRGWTSLMYAAWYGHREVIELLLAAGAKIGARGTYGQNVLFYVMRKHRDDWNRSFCSFCSGRETRKDIAKLLCEKGADVLATNDYGYSVLDRIPKCEFISQDERTAIEGIFKQFGAK